jgi:Rap1a immunity proteins
MKKNIGFKLPLIILTSFCMSSFAGSDPINVPDLTTAKLNLECNRLLGEKTKEAGFNQGLCVGIVLGVEDNAHYDKKICVPKDVNIRDRLIVVKNYVETQPKRMKEAYASLVFDALAQKWPCSPKRS